MSLFFFESINELKKFKNCELFLKYSKDFIEIPEHVNPIEKETFVMQASTLKKVTLLTRDFGRSTDFVLFDERVSKNGGIHVIQTFLSGELSKEIQIKGRAAGQGDDGSYSLILSLP